MITSGFGMTIDLERGTMRQWTMGRDGVKRWADTNELADGMKMGLTDYAVQRDKFQAEEVTNGFDFPCGVCIHRRVTDMDEPCRTCDHNMRSVPEEPDDKTPMARLYGCCADEVPNVRVERHPEGAKPGAQRTVFALTRR